MTRITNFARKRRYLEAGFGNADADKRQNELHNETISKPEVEEKHFPKKTWKSRRKKTNVVVHAEEPIDTCQTRTILAVGKQVTIKMARSGEKRNRYQEHSKGAASERRRLNRIEERQASMTCLACRKKGHTVKDCPEARIALHEYDTRSAGVPVTSTVGICYRCGSKRHNLSRCKNPGDPENPLPFASCFVCSRNGHLASSCPQNHGKGIYPNGGSCKLCGQTSHLAKDCELRKQGVTSKSALMLGSTQTEAGADEDDFHVLKRRLDAVEKEDSIIQSTANKYAGVLSNMKTKVVVFK